MTVDFTGSILQNRSVLSSLLGIMFGGNRKVYDVYGYRKTVTYNDILSRYGRQDITARIVDAPANALWCNPPTMITDNNAWKEIWDTIVEKQNLYQVLSRIDKMAAMGTYSALLIGVDSGNSLEVALNTSPKNVIFLQPYSVDSAVIESFNNDKTSASFATPEMYKISTNKNIVAVGSKARIPDFKVHASRILHIAENHLENTIFGNPRMLRIFNLLDDLLKVVGGTAETYWLTSNRGMQIDVDKEVEMTPDDEDALTDEVEEYIHNLSRVMKTRGVKINNLGADVPNPKEVFSMLMSLISGTTGIPKRILLGSEAGQLASEQDRANWAERIDERRCDFGEATVLRPLITKLTEGGVLPEADVEIVWPEAFRLNPFESAQTSAQNARSAINLVKTLNERPDFIDITEARDIVGLDPKDETFEEVPIIETPITDDNDNEEGGNSEDDQQDRDENNIDEGNNSSSVII